MTEMTEAEFDALATTGTPVEIHVSPDLRVHVQDELDNPEIHRRAMRRRRPSWADEE